MPLYPLRVELASTMMTRYDITTLVYVDGSSELEDVTEVYGNISEFEGGIGISLGIFQSHGHRRLQPGAIEFPHIRYQKGTNKL